MRVLVTGANGQVGTYLAEMGERCGHQLTALDRGQLDLTNPSSIRSAFNQFAPELVINAAAIPP